MLTPDDLTVIRAALRYFYDELIPHGPKAIAPYLDEPLNADTLTAQHVTQLCRRFARCNIRWVIYSPETEELRNAKLLRSVDAVDYNQELHFATVLMPYIQIQL